MAEKSSFFNSVAGDRKYAAADFANYFNSILTNGVFPSPSTNLQLISNSNMTVTIKAGKAFINGYVYTLDTDLIATLSTANGTLNRIDRIVIQFSSTGRAINAVVKTGTAASTPVAPVLQRDADYYELGIADVLVSKGVTIIPQAKITDLRLNATYCGWVNSLIKVDAATLYAQLTDSFNTWFTSLQTQLSGDVAGNLQTEITALDNTTYKKTDWVYGTGWERNPLGTITQKGIATIKNNHLAITFPTSFTDSSSIVIELTMQNVGSSSYGVWSGQPNINTVNVYANTTANVVVYWTATGK